MVSYQNVKIVIKKPKNEFCEESKRIVWRYQRVQLKVEEGQTIQWSKEKEQKDKQWSTKHYTEN